MNIGSLRQCALSEISSARNLLVSGDPLSECYSWLKGSIVQNSQRRISNTLFYGDNLGSLPRGNRIRKYRPRLFRSPLLIVKPVTIFCSRRLLENNRKTRSKRSMDIWHWNTAEKAFDEVMAFGNLNTAELLRAMRSFLKENDMMAYLTMMAIRLLELHACDQIYRHTLFAL